MKWYLSQLIMEISVFGSKRNVVHKNLILIRAKTSEQAYKKAKILGKNSETSYLNPKNQEVKIKFRGIGILEEMYESPEDGAELMFQEYVGVSPQKIKSWLPSKRELQVFTKPKPFKKRDPDYSSKEIVEMVLRNLQKKEKKRSKK
jgi:hypothetical protein